MPDPLALPGSYQPGSVIAGRYRIESVLGHGGMGIVLAAEHLFLRHRVALKVMLTDRELDDEAVSRFEREARVAVSLRSEHVARVLDAGRTESGEPFIAMELLSGTDLESLVQNRGRLPIEEACTCVLAVCEALAEAHARGIVHRDLKPANLFLSRRPDGSPIVKVLDFGISKIERSSEAPAITSNSRALGSPAFMSPEQIRSPRSVDARTDIWSLGVVLYRLCTGGYPFPGTTPTEVIARVLTDPPADFETGAPLPDAVRVVILRCLRKSVDQRYADVAALAADLARLAPPEARVHAERARRVLGASDATLAPNAAQVATAAGATTTSAFSTPHLPRRSRRRTALVVSALAGVALSGAAAIVVLAPPSTKASLPAPSPPSLPAPAPPPRLLGAAPDAAPLDAAPAATEVRRGPVPSGPPSPSGPKRPRPRATKEPPRDLFDSRE